MFECLYTYMLLLYVVFSFGFLHIVYYVSMCVFMNLIYTCCNSVYACYLLLRFRVNCIAHPARRAECFRSILWWVDWFSWRWWRAADTNTRTWRFGCETCSLMLNNVERGTLVCVTRLTLARVTRGHLVVWQGDTWSLEGVLFNSLVHVVLAITCS